MAGYSSVLMACLFLYTNNGKEFTADVSGYCACKICCGPTARGIMANGKKVRIGAIAAPKNYPFNTKIWIPGYGKGIVSDRGSAIVNSGKRYKTTYVRYDRLDLFFTTHQEALNWGRKTLKVRIMK